VILTRARAVAETERRKADALAKAEAGRRPDGGLGGRPEPPQSR
jgi:hypothetical protein